MHYYFFDDKWHNIWILQKNNQKFYNGFVLFLTVERFYLKVQTANINKFLSNKNKENTPRDLYFKD